jgi:predicted HAD superfamily hydrolase
MPLPNATQVASLASRTNGARADFILRVTELLQRIERTDRTRAHLHRVKITNERKARAAEKAFDHEFDHLVAAAAELRELLNEEGV